MRNQIIYEWDWELFDTESDDILDHVHFDKMSDYPSNPYSHEDGKSARLVLVRDEGNEDDGVVDRMWAYVENGKLPEEFAYAGAGEMRPNGVRVPKKFHKQLERWYYE